MMDDLSHGTHGWIGRKGGGAGVTNVDWVYISIVVGVHVAIWKKAIGKE
jgi:hypothetical protein